MKPGFLLAVAILSAATGTVSAQERDAPAPEPEATSPFGTTRPVGNDGLSRVAGRSDLAQVVSAQNKGVVSGNMVTGTSQTGTIQFDGGSFQGPNGLSLLSANTGNNVAINSSLNVNVTIRSQ